MILVLIKMKDSILSAFMMLSKILRESVIIDIIHTNAEELVVLVILDKPQKEITTFFHNGSKYHYHTIIKQPEEEFEGQFECLGENNEKYITFSLSAEKQEDGNATQNNTIKNKICQ